MRKLIGIRREDKNIWERRVPLIPEHLNKLKTEFGIESLVQPFERRAFAADEFIASGSEIKENLTDCPTIFGVKEVPINLLMENKTYLFFSHTIKGQSYNMPLLQKLLDLKCTLIDYECITNEKGQRLVFFGRFAGLAGMIDALYGMGQRFQSLGFETPFQIMKQAYQYAHLEEALEDVKVIGEQIKQNGLPKEITPLAVGFSGYGNVSKGAQEVFDLLPFNEISPAELLKLESGDTNKLYKVVFKEVDMFEPKDSALEFELQDYFTHPEKYKSKFENYLGKMTVLINAIYWHDKCPMLISKDYLKNNFDKVKLQLVADISCDIDGAIQFTYKATEPDNPAFVYNPKTNSFNDGFAGEGIVDITIDNLPTELPRNSSIAFGESLIKFVPSIVNSDFTVPFDELKVVPEIKNAIVVYNGKLTPKYEYLNKYLNNKYKIK